MKRRILYYDNIRYFAAKSGRKKGSLAKYTLNRYIQFALMGVFVNTLYLTVDLFNVFPNKSITVAQVIRSGLLLSDDIFPPFWCMKLFLLGGVICYANKKYEVSTAIRSAVHAVVRVPGKPGWNAAGSRVYPVAGGMCCCRIFCE